MSVYVDRGGDRLVAEVCRDDRQRYTRRNHPARTSVAQIVDPGARIELGPVKGGVPDTASETDDPYRVAVVVDEKPLGAVTELVQHAGRDVDGPHRAFGLRRAQLNSTFGVGALECPADAHRPLVSVNITGAQGSHLAETGTAGHQELHHRLPVVG